jgi:hypothetical protein
MSNKIQSQLLKDLVTMSKLPLLERMPALLTIKGKYDDKDLDKAYDALSLKQQVAFYDGMAAFYGGPKYGEAISALNQSIR